MKCIQRILGIKNWYSIKGFFSQEFFVINNKQALLPLKIQK